ncbi:GGDEF domain-containing protein [Aminipila sp.]|uniref:GGDEF domain-containing protein n=1 Tax=Aminipila sp. TaxID=2060095 RepID=UPI00289693D1|nr:GGDEF domain-containing protein [Aminipila sp.]
MDKTKQFFTILKGGHIKTVYQPIVSLEDGRIFGYEALSRIKLTECELNIEELFHIAAQKKKLWELEKVCRTEALKNAVKKPKAAKLFLNVDANIIHDPELRSGFTREKLRQYGLHTQDIIFEITEKSAIHALDVFKASIEHYQSQDFEIAIDDFGSGYSGLNRVCSFSPNFIKIDMELVRCMDTDSVKRSIVGAIVQFCKEAKIKVIAEGIERRDELRTLIDIGADYGQGYYLAKPSEGFCQIEAEKKLLIKNIKNQLKISYQPSIFSNIDAICKKKNTVKYKEKSINVYNLMQNDEEITEVSVVDEDNKVCGILTRTYLLQKFSGQFGYNLSQRRTAGEIMKTEFLAVERNKSIDEVAMLAMNRNSAEVYEAIIVTDEQKYMGVVTVKDLLNTAINIQVKRATDANPLTGLPGNFAVQEKIVQITKDKGPFAIVYLDLDNFKAYNDAYGFTNGDLMIKILADSMRACCNEIDFKGHIGGDDFVIITQSYFVEELCMNIINSFSRSIKALYSKEDWEQGYIISKNRSGFTEKFPIATLSIAAVTNKNREYTDLEELSKIIADTKKRCKQKAGNAVITV